MLKTEECNCKTCMKHGELSKYDIECRNHSVVPSDDYFFPPTRLYLWCCQGLWRDPNGRFWTWEQITKGETAEGVF